MGIAFPESELRNDFATNPDGSMGEYRTPVSVQNAITAGMRKPDYCCIRVPVLAFYTLPTVTARWLASRTLAERRSRKFRAIRNDKSA